jgi:type VI secretion system secreted protein Hcp
MSKKWLITLIALVVLVSVVVCMTPALASGKPVLAPAENTLSQDQVVEPSAQSQTSPDGIISSDVIPGDYIMLLKIDGIFGESTYINHKDWVELLSFSWGLSQPATAMTSGASSSRVQVLDFNFSHLLDKASPLLMSYCSMGKRIKDATLELFYPGESGQRFYQLIMTDVVVSKVNIAGSSLLPISETSTAQAVLFKPVEDVALTFAKIEWSYWPVKPDGSVEPAIKGSLDLRRR